MSKIDLSKLTKEEKLQLFDLLEKKQTFAKQRKTAFKPHATQLPVISSEVQNRFVFCSNGWGKSAALVNECFWAAQGYNPITKKSSYVPARIIVVVDNPTKIDDVFLSEAHKWFIIKPEQLHKRGKPYVSEISFPNGSSISFMSSQQEPLSFESIEWDFLAIDEPLPKAVFVALRRGGRTKGRVQRILFVGTPIAASWLRKDIYEPWAKGELPEFECFRGAIEDNRQNLADGYIESFGRVLSDKEKAIRLRGEWFDLDGLALAHLLDRRKHLTQPFQWPEHWPCIVAIDPHPRKAHNAVLLGIGSDNSLFYITELSKKAVAREFATMLKQWYQSYRVIDIVVDSLGSGEMTSGDGFKSFIKVLNEEGVRARPTTWDDKNDEDFIQRIQDVLVIPAQPDQFGERWPKLRIFHGNPGIVSDLENVSWLKHRGIDELKPKLDITNKDYLSCLKYALAANPHFQKGEARVYVKSAPATSYGQGFSKGRQIRLRRRSKL